MSDEVKTPEPIILEVHGRKFDVSTPEGMAQHKIWAEALSSTAGALGARVGELEKEVQPLRTYNLKNATPDEAAIAAKLSEFRASGDHEAADRLVLEYARQVKQETETQKEQDRLFSDYVKANPETFKHVPEDVMKDYVFRNYGSKLAESDDPFGLLDRIVKPKVTRQEPAAQPPASTLGASTVVPSRPDPKADEDDAKKGDAAWGSLYKEFGFK